MSNQPWQRGVQPQLAGQAPQQPLQQQFNGALPFMNAAGQGGLPQTGTQNVNTLAALSNVLGGAQNTLQGAVPQTSTQGAAPQNAAPVNPLQAMLQQLQQQQMQSKSPLPQQSASLAQLTSAVGQGPQSIGQQSPAVAAQNPPFGVSASGTMSTQAAQAPLNIQNLTPLQQAQLQQLQQIQRQQQQQQLATLLAALLPLQAGGLAQNPQLQGLLAGQNAPLLNVNGSHPRPEASAGPGGLRRDGITTDDRRGRGYKGDADYRDRRRDYRDDSRDRKGRRDRSRSPDRGRRRPDRRRDYRSDSDSDDSYYESRRRGGSRDRGRRHSPARRSTQPESALQDGILQTRHLWIGDMPAATSEREIRQVFGRHGTIEEVKMLPIKKERASCFLAYHTKASATKCINTENLFGGKAAVVRINSRFVNMVEQDAHETKQAAARDLKPPYASVLIKGLNHHNVNREDILREFQKITKVLDAHKRHDSDDVVVEFETAADANKANSMIRANDLWGPRVTVQVIDKNENQQGSTVQVVERSSPTSGRPPYGSRGDGLRPAFRDRRAQMETPSLYIPQVPAELDRMELQRACEPYGDVESLRIIPGKYSKHSMAFVNFYSIESAKRALENLSGKRMFGMLEPLKVEFAQSAAGGRRREMSESSAARDSRPPFFANRSLVLNHRENPPREVSLKTEAPDAPVVVIRNFSPRLSGREIMEALQKLLGAKFTGRKDISLFNIASPEDCYAVVTGLGQWAEQAVKDLDNLEFFGSPLSTRLSTAREALNEAPDQLNTATMRVGIAEVHRIVPVVSYHPIDEDAFAVESRRYGVLHFTNLGPSITRQIMVQEVIKIAHPMITELNASPEQSVEAFIVFASKSAARQVKEKLDNAEIGAEGEKRGVHIGYAEIYSSVIRVRTESHIPREELTRVFSRYGTIKNQLHTLEDLRSAFIEYDSIESAQRAVGGMNGEIIGGFRDELAVEFYDCRVESALRGEVQPGAQDQDAEQEEEYEEEEEYGDEGEVILEGQVMPMQGVSKEGTPQLDAAAGEDANSKKNGAGHEQPGGMVMDMDVLEQYVSDLAQPAYSKVKPGSSEPMDTTGTNHVDGTYAETGSAMEITPESKGLPAVSYTTRIALKTKEATLQVHILSGSSDPLFVLPVPPETLKMTQRFKVAVNTLQELERKLTPDKADQWTVAVALPADEASSEMMNAIVDYFASRDAAGMAVVNGTSVSLLPPSTLANDMLGRYAQDPSITEQLGDGKFLVMVVIKP